MAYKTPEQGLAIPKATWAPWLAPKRGFIFTVGTAGQAGGTMGTNTLEPRAPAQPRGGLNNGNAPKVKTLAYKRTRLAVYLRCVAWRRRVLNFYIKLPRYPQSPSLMYRATHAGVNTGFGPAIVEISRRKAVKPCDFHTFKPPRRRYDCLLWLGGGSYSAGPFPYRFYPHP